MPDPIDPGAIPGDNLRPDMPRHNAYRRKRPGHIVDDRFSDLGVRLRGQQPEGLTIVHGLKDVTGIVGAYLKRSFQRRYG